MNIKKVLAAIWLCFVGLLSVFLWAALLVPFSNELSFYGIIIAIAFCFGVIGIVLLLVLLTELAIDFLAGK